ncbi:MAG: DUF4922 domain-containing protein [Muribaculaceae bacterium]|nr:DUF4922 domain-containing protein [Muribaculaceae bacterium]
MTSEELSSFFTQQKEDWPLASRNYAALVEVNRKPFKAGGLEGFVEFNPARALSTLAKVDRETIRQRECFLCKNHRPEEQLSLPLLDGEFELLVNPYPVVEQHFTIASTKHDRQRFLAETGYQLAAELPGMVVFFNHAGAGASAPDHLHYQAVPKESLPLIKILEENGERHLPFKIYEKPEDFNLTEEPLNAFFWKTLNQDFRGVVVRRKAHRPVCFYREPPLRRAVSPGAIDIAGRIIIPCEDDFNLITDKEIEAIFREVAH